MNKTQLSLLALVTLILSGCASQLPKRYVIENGIGPWSYRRYQRVLDVEFPHPPSQAEGHTATYIRRRDGAVPIATAFVTLYDEPKALTAKVQAHLDDLMSYDIEVKKRHGHYLWHLSGGEHLWAMWVSGPFLVKLGAPRGMEKVPSDILTAYFSQYPSDLNRHGRAREGSKSAGEISDSSDSGEKELPKHLRDNAPR